MPGSALLWFALPPSSPVSQRPSLRLRLMPTTASTATLTPMEATGPMDMPDTPMPIMASTMARGPLMLSPPPLPSPMLMPTTTAPMVWDTLDTTVWATGPMDMPDTHMLMLMATTTARGPLRLSPPPLPSLRLMPTTATTAMVPGPTTATVWATEDTLDTTVWATEDTLETTVWATEATGDKFSAVESTKQKLKANITPCYLTQYHSVLLFEV